MARIYSGKKGKHGSKRPPIKVAPKWTKIKKEEVGKIVEQLAKERKSSALIGLILRDQYGIPDARALTGKSVSQMMREKNLYPEMPEDMLNLLSKAVHLRSHLERYKADKHSRKGLENLESKIRRLGKYYSRKGLLPKNWQYSPEEAKLIIQK